MIKTWLITATAPVAGCEEHYVVYSENTPEDLPGWDDFIINITQDLWDNYSWCLHLDDEEYESQEEEDEVYEQAWEDWKCDCNINVDEATEEDLKDVAPGGYIGALEIIHDERN